MVPLVLKPVCDPRYPEFILHRVQACCMFEPATPEHYPGSTTLDGVLIDTGAGYSVIPHAVHSAGLLKIHQELGVRPYRIVSADCSLQLQRFAEVGLCLVAKQPDGTYRHWPEGFLRVRAYLLDADTQPKTKALIGVDTLLEHFILHLEKGNSYLAARNSDLGPAPVSEAGVSPPAGTDAAAPDRP